MQILGRTSSLRWRKRGIGLPKARIIAGCAWKLRRICALRQRGTGTHRRNAGAPWVAGRPGAGRVRRSFGKSPRTSDAKRNGSAALQGGVLCAAPRRDLHRQHEPAINGRLSFQTSPTRLLDNSLRLRIGEMEAENWNGSYGECSGSQIGDRPSRTGSQNRIRITDTPPGSH